MRNQHLNIDFAPAYLLTNSKQKIEGVVFEDEKKKISNIIYNPPARGGRQALVKTYDNLGGILDTCLVEPGMMLILDSADPNLGFFLLRLQPYNEDLDNNLIILKSKISEYVELGVLIPLDQQGMLAYEYGIL